MFETPLPETQLGHFPILYIGQELAGTEANVGSLFIFTWH